VPVDVGELGPFFGEQTNVLIRGFGQEFRKIRDPLIADAWPQSAIAISCIHTPGESRLPIWTIRYDLEKDFFILQDATRLPVS
jgi:hypothetical protein